MVSLKKAGIVIATLFACSKAFNQTVLTDTTNVMFGNAYELSGLVASEGKFYFVSEKCRKMFVRSSEQNKVVNLNLSSLASKDVEFEGVAMYRDSQLFVCDEKNARVISIDLSSNKVTEVPVDTDLSQWKGNFGMEGIAVDRAKDKLFLLREKDGLGHSEIRVFNIVRINNQVSLKVSDTLIINHSNSKWRYSDISYNTEKQQLFLIRSHFNGECNIGNRYIIDTINMIRHSSRLALRNNANELNSEGLAYRDISTLINSLCQKYSTNLEGIAIDKDHIYLISDNQEGVEKCEAKGDKYGLFIKFPLAVSDQETSISLRGQQQGTLPQINCSGQAKRVEHAFSVKNNATESWGRSVTLPAKGRFAEEDHYVTTQDKFDGKKYPSNTSENITQHINHSLGLYKRYDSAITASKLYKSKQVWTPSEGGAKGQASIGDLQLKTLTPQDEMWLLSMMWAKGHRPKMGQKFLVTSNSKNVVVVGGYERGPQFQKFLGGLTREVHRWLGTNDSSEIEVRLLEDQTVSSGPCNCRD